MKRSGFSGNLGGMGTSGGVTSIKSVSQLGTEETNQISLFTTSNQNTNITGSSSHYGATDYNVQIALDWYPTMTDKVRVFASWYFPGDYLGHDAYIVYAKSLDDITGDTLRYAGDWDDDWLYPEGIIVKYDNMYYQCIQNHTEAQCPDNSDYWIEVSVPSLDVVKASVGHNVFLPRNFDRVVCVDDVTPGELYSEDVGQTHLGWYVSCWVSYSYLENNMFYSNCVYRYTYNPISFNRLNHTPTIGYNNSTNKITINSNQPGKYLMEFSRTDGYNPTGYDLNIRNEFFLTSMVRSEDDNAQHAGYSAYYQYLEAAQLHRWRKGEHTVGITYLDNTNQDQMMWAVSAAIDSINTILNPLGVSFTLLYSTDKDANGKYNNTKGDITVTCGSHDDLFGFEASESRWFNGQWQTDIDGYGYITQAQVALRNDGEWHTTFQATAMEELFQTMGAGNDQWDYNVDETTHLSFSYLNKTTLIYDESVDADILRILYSDYVDVNMSAAEVAVAVNATNGMTIVQNDQKLSFLEPEKSYKLKVYVLQEDGKLSYPSNTLTITVPLPSADRPENWVWGITSNTQLPVDSEGVHPVTAVQWNGFTERINEFREYAGYSAYNFTIVGRGSDFKAAYNQAVSAIKPMTLSALTRIETGTKLSSELFTQLDRAIENIT